MSEEKKTVTLGDFLGANKGISKFFNAEGIKSAKIQKRMVKLQRKINSEVFEDYNETLKKLQATYETKEEDTVAQKNDKSINFSKELETILEEPVEIEIRGFDYEKDFVDKKDTPIIDFTSSELISLIKVGIFKDFLADDATEDTTEEEE